MQVYLRILKYGKAYRQNAALSFACLLVYTLASAVSLMSVIPFLNILFGNDKPEPPTIPFSYWDMAALKSHGYYALNTWIEQSPDKIQILYAYCSVLFAAILVKNLARYLSDYFITPLEQGITRELRNHLFGHLTTLGLPFYTARKKGDILTVLMSDVQIIEEAIIGTVMNLMREPLTMLVFLMSMLLISWKLSLFTFFVLPITGLFLNFISKKLKRTATSGQELLGQLLSIAEEFITGIRIVKSYQKEEYEKKRYQQKNVAHNRLSIQFRNRVNLASPVTELISILTVCAILIYGGSMILGGTKELKPNEFIGFIAVFSQFLMPLKNLSSAISKANKAQAAYARIEELLAVKAQIKSPEQPVPFQTLQEEIRFENVSFKYKDEWVLKEISFSLKKGETLAVVGPSGSGKSTLADLLPRFYDVQEGAIYFDGIDIRNISLFDLRKQLGYVTQEGVLFHDTVLKNIAYGEENPDFDRVKQAAKTANAEEFILNLPEGYDTFIGERGLMLSGGQRQRLSIARAIYRNPPILILDEATSNLDTESEKLVQDALEAVMQHRTSIIIAHRLSTILHADKILVIEKGKLIEQGTHEELLQKGGLYQRLYDGGWE
ncbi:MAG: ABC transporter ATP-binding protein [Bacteroidia bacterium]